MINWHDLFGFYICVAGVMWFINGMMHDDHLVGRSLLWPYVLGRFLFWDMLAVIRRR